MVPGSAHNASITSIIQQFVVLCNSMQSMTSNTPETLLPVALGHEKEVGLLIGEPGKLVEPIEFFAKIESYIPPKVLGYGSFLVNGYRVYKGGSTFIEVATPECGSPKELVKYMRAAVPLVDSIVLSYATEVSANAPSPVIVRFQDRVVDSYGSRKGSHMNIGLQDYDNKPVDIPTILAHQATRSFVSGAGYIGNGRLRYAQKVGGIVKLENYGYSGSMYRITKEEGTTRFEDRCGDVNISDWAAWMHAGSLALAAGISRTPLRTELTQTATITADTIKTAKAMNVMRIQKDGTVLPNYSGFTAVDFQQKLAELTMDKLEFHTDVPEMYFEVARALFKYCELYRAILKGGASLYALAGQADWAAKMALVLHGIEKDEEFSIRRRVYDMKARITDLRYDFHGYTVENKKVTKSSWGKGHTLRQRGILPNMVSDLDVKGALAKAPTSTRAHLRGKLLRDFNVQDCHWHYVRTVDPANDKTVAVSLDNVWQTELTASDADKLADIKQKPQQK